MKVDIIKILAEGSYKSFMTFVLPSGESVCVYISRDLYYKLKVLGVPTSQSLRRKK